MRKSHVHSIERYHRWFGTDTLEAVKETVVEDWIASTGTQIHLDLYHSPFQPEGTVGTIVFSHGIAGYGRLVAPFALALRAHGFNVVCPDLKGYGHCKGLRGDWTWDELVQNLHDSIDYASNRFGGRLFLAGASMGGTLAYHAACRRSDLTALGAYCLFDYREPAFLREVSRFGALTPLVAQITHMGGKLLPQFRIPAGLVALYEHVAEDPGFVKALRDDPMAGNWMSLRAVSSMLAASPPVEYADFTTPTVVLQPDEDRMVPPRWSRILYNRLGCRKRYVTIPKSGHWTVYPEQLEYAVEAMAKWFRETAATEI